jgi:hypothetical protein
MISIKRFIIVSSIIFFITLLPSILLYTLGYNNITTNCTIIDHRILKKSNCSYPCHCLKFVDNTDQFNVCFKRCHKACYIGVVHFRYQIDNYDYNEMIQEIQTWKYNETESYLNQYYPVNSILICYYEKDHHYIKRK